MPPLTFTEGEQELWVGGAVLPVPCPELREAMEEGEAENPQCGAPYAGATDLETEALRGKRN